MGWSINIYDKLKYRRDKKPNEIRLPTQNDAYSKMTSLSLGIMLIIGSIVWLLLMTDFTFMPILGLLGGGLILINGLIDLPKGLLKIENFNIKLFGIKKGILISEIKLIEMLNDKLTIYDNQNYKITIDKLELNEEWFEKTEDFFKNNLDMEQIEIKRLN